MKPEITELELLLDKINLLFNQIKVDGNIDKIEAELFLKYIHQLALKVERLKDGNTVQPPEIKKEIMIENIKSEPIVIPEVKEIEIKRDEKKQEEKKPEEKINVIPEVNVKAFEKLQPGVETKQPEKKLQKKSLVNDHDNDEDEKFGLHGKLSKEKKTLADKINNKKSADLRSSIDLNERIYFTRQLFKGDSKAYENAVNYLNTLTTGTEAEHYIESTLMAQFGWKDAEAISQFKEAVQQKFR